MDFSESISFSLRKQNIPKLLTIVLVSVIAGVSIWAVSIALQVLWLAVLIAPVVLAYSLFVSGYMISIIETVMDGYEELPNFRIGRDLGRGALVLVASIVYMIPLFVLMAVFIGLMIGFADPMAQSDSSEVGAIFAVCGMIIGMVVIGAGLGYSLIVGQIRYAVEGRAGALFNIGKNFGIVMSNLGKTFGLFFRQIGIAMIFGFVSSVLVNVVSAFFSRVSSDAIEALSYSDWDMLFSLGMPLAVFGALYYVIYLTINLMQSFSSAHLIASYGKDLGLSNHKFKNQ